MKLHSQSKYNNLTGTKESTDIHKQLESEEEKRMTETVETSDIAKPRWIDQRKSKAPKLRRYKINVMETEKLGLTRVK